LNLENKNKNLKSEEVDDLINNRPGWLLSNAISLIFIFVIGVVMFSIFIELPRVVKKEITIYNKLNPVPVQSKLKGRIVKTAKLKSGSSVEKGQFLAQIESNSEYEDIIDVKFFLEKTMRNNLFDQGVPKSFNMYHLGELQNDFFQLCSRWSLMLYKKKDYEQSTLSLNDEMANIENVLRHLKRKKILVESILNIESEKYLIFEKLYEDGVSTKIENRNDLLKRIESEMPAIDVDLAIENQNLLLIQKKATIEYKRQIYEEELENLKGAINVMRESIETWELEHIIRSPISGVAYFPIATSESAIVENGQELFKVIPIRDKKEQELGIYGEVIISSADINDIEEGDKVKVFFKNVDFITHGFVQGSVSSIMEVPFVTDQYQIIVLFPSGLKSISGYEFRYKYNIIADAEIIIESETMFNRILKPIIKLGSI
jgi:hypothetical protein